MLYTYVRINVLKFLTGLCKVFIAFYFFYYHDNWILNVFFFFWRKIWNSKSDDANDWAYSGILCCIVWTLAMPSCPLTYFANSIQQQRFWYYSKDYSNCYCEICWRILQHKLESFDYGACWYVLLSANFSCRLQQRLYYSNCQSIMYFY